MSVEKVSACASSYVPAFRGGTVNLVRLLWVVVLVLCYAFAGRLDALLASAWEVVASFSLVHSETFEPLVSTASFAFWINVWRAVDLWMPGLHQYRVDQGEQRGLVCSWSSERRWYLNHSPIAAAAYLAPLFLFDRTFSGRRRLTLEPPTMAQLAVDLCTTVFLYDLFFYSCHLAMHRFSALRGIHAKHHTAVPLRANEVIRLSFIDGSLQVACNVLALRLGATHSLSRILHDLVVTYMLTEIHSNYDLPFMAHNVVPFGLLGGSPKHHLHHATGKKHFHQFFTLLDRAFGFY